VLAGDDRAGAVVGERLVPAGERLLRAGRLVLGRGEQAERALGVVADILVVRVLQGVPVLGDAPDVGPQLRPAREPVVPRDPELRFGEFDAFDAREVLRALAQLVQAGFRGQRAHSASFPRRPWSAGTGQEEGAELVVR
jgi:hypothetical protein